MLLQFGDVVQVQKTESSEADLQSDSGGGPSPQTLHDVLSVHGCMRAEISIALTHRGTCEVNLDLRTLNVHMYMTCDRL